MESTKGNRKNKSSTKNEIAAWKKRRRVKVQREAWREDSIMEVYHQKDRIKDTKSYHIGKRTIAKTAKI